MASETTSQDVANERAAEVYRQLEGKAGPAYLRLEECVNELCSEAMHAIGAETAAGDLDPAAQELFGDVDRVIGQVAQELAEHVHQATRRYLESQPRAVAS